MAEEGQEKSIGWVIAAIMAVILVGGWVFAAAEYHQDSGGGISVPIGGRVPRSLRPLDRRDLVFNAIAQLPNFPSVVAFVFRERFWLVPVVVLAEGLALGLLVLMKKVERDLNGPRQRGRR